jgi:hypothetical protein
MHPKPLLIKLRISTRAMLKTIRRVRLRRKLEGYSILKWNLFQKENQL